MSTPAERIRDALKSVCSSIPAGRSLRASADAALAALAELERERDELRAKLAEYERAPTVARVIFENHAREVCNAISREHLPPVGTDLIARPTRKDGE